jgi:release factor glutamine methyltransferase
VQALELAGCVAAVEEADELVRAASDADELELMLARRARGEPLAWVTGSTVFCGIEVAVDPGVYVPRWQSEPLALAAVGRLPAEGVGVDLCTGAGAIAMVMRSSHPLATVVGTEIDPVAARCARRNGVNVYEGDLEGPLPAALEGRVDVIVGVLPYVPSDKLQYLPRDVQHFEPPRALDGGAGGLEVLAEAILRSPRWIRPGGWLLLELGGDQVESASERYCAAGYGEIDVLEDEDGDVRAILGQRLEAAAGIDS